jgi:class 3 adenylate cyclase/tetratricopeptide (TPR) repeat protein
MAGEAMKCPECQIELPNGFKFCKECGTKLELTCPGCGKSIPPDSKFCPECGHNLTSSAETALPKDLSFDEKLAKIQKYLPGGLTEKILSQRDRIEGERRHVTIMFVDMKGFTPLTEKLGPEVTFSLMDKVFELIIHKVHDYEGTVNELRGDGVLAFFGAPIALEDAPQRAIRSSLAIHRELTRFNDKLKAEKIIPPVLVRIGINSGPVVVGTVGNDLRVQFTAVGDTINMAARMEQLAEPGTTYVTEGTFKLTEGFFRFEALGEKEIKGKEKPMKVYQVIAPSTRRTRFDVSAERGLSKFIGRARELELLLDSFERAKAGRGQAVSIMGEAGVGKSRLLYEFRKTVANENIVFLEGKCLSYGRGLSYHPIIDILKSNFAVEEGDTDDRITDKVRRGLTILEVDETSTLPYLLELLSVKDSGIDNISMSPEAIKDRIHRALQRIILKGSEQRPLVFAFEDLHWMDKSSEEAAKYLMESIPGARVLMIFTYRPEFVHTWGGKSFHSQLNINRLSNRESLAMVADLLGSDSIAPDLQDLILEKTEGVPFFIEEFVRSLVNMGIIERTGDAYHVADGVNRVTIPSTIQDVIMARVDSLPDAAKEVLQAGATIEREFSYELIKAVTALPEPELLSHLAVLKDAELLYERGIFPQSIFIFRHALTREVVYDAILAKRRKLLHEKIGTAIEDLYAQNIHEHYVRLAEHFITSGNFDKGAQYSNLVARSAYKTGSLVDAATFGEKAVLALERLPRTDEVLRKIVDFRTFTAIYMSFMNRFLEAKTMIEPVAQLSLTLGDKKRGCQILSILGGYDFCVKENFAGAFDHLSQSLKLARETGNVAYSLDPNYWMAYALSLSCEFDKALRHLEEVLEVVSAKGTFWRISTMKSLTSHLTYHYRKLDQAHEMSHDAVRVAEESGDIYSQAMGHSCLGITLHAKGSTDSARKHLLIGQEHAMRIDLFFWLAMTSQYLGEMCLDTGEFEAAKDHYERAIHFMEEIGWLPSWINLNRIASARAKVMLGEKAVDLESLHSYVRDNRITLYEGWMRRHLGEILLNMGDAIMSEAETLIKEAIEADDRNGVISHLGRDIAVYAELFKRKGDKEKAKEQLGRAIGIYKECGADGWVTKAEEELGRLS